MMYNPFSSAIGMYRSDYITVHYKPKAMKNSFTQVCDSFEVNGACIM